MIYIFIVGFVSKVDIFAYMTLESCVRNRSDEGRHFVFLVVEHSINPLKQCCNFYNIYIYIYIYKRAARVNKNRRIR